MNNCFMCESFKNLIRTGHKPFNYHFRFNDGWTCDITYIGNGVWIREECNADGIMMAGPTSFNFDDVSKYTKLSYNITISLTAEEADIPNYCDF